MEGVKIHEHEETFGMKAIQPKGLYVLFLTEMWERFGYYTLTTILVLYLSQALHFSDDQSYLLFSALNAMMYLTPVAGGYIADRWLGYRQSIYCGGVLLLIGYLLAATSNLHLFYLGLGFLVLGNGLFKPNVSSIVGTLYGENDPRREGGFTLFYMGINVGALVPPLFTGWVVNHWGWHIAFIFAGIGMLISVVTLFAGRKILGVCGTMPETSTLRLSAFHRVRFYTWFIVAMVIALAVFEVVLYYPAQANWLLIIASFVILLFVLKMIFKNTTHWRNKMLASLILIVLSLMFWALYNQTFTSLMLFANRNLDLTLFGIPITPEFTQFYNSFFIIAISPLLSWLWVKLDPYHLNPSIPTKFAMGIGFMGVGFVILGVAATWFGHGGIISGWWLVLSYLSQTIGELVLSPIGLAMITVLSPKESVGTMMGVWFLTLAAAYAVSGELSLLASIPDKLNLTQSLAVYSHAFWLYGIMALILTLVSIALIPYLKKLSR